MTIEKRTIAYLNNKLSVPTYGAEPTNPRPSSNQPSEFCIVQKVGGGESNYIQSASLAVQSYAATLERASELNEVVKSAMKAMVELDEVTSVKLDTDYEYSKESTKQPRYQAVFDIVYY